MNKKMNTVQDLRMKISISSAKKYYPFLRFVIDADLEQEQFPNEIFIRKMDSDFLNYVPMATNKTREHIHFVLSDGTIAYYTVYQGYMGDKEYGETVLQAIKRYEEMESIDYMKIIHYFVLVHVDYEDDKNNTVTIIRVKPTYPPSDDSGHLTI